MRAVVALRHLPRGKLATSADYALSSDGLHPSHRTGNELGCALARIGANAARLGGDPATPGLSGKSAGENLVLDLACRADAEHLRSARGGTVPRLAAAVAYPAIDRANVHDDRDPVLGGVARGMATRCTGGAPARYPARYHAITSSERVDPAAPPTWLLIPIQDRLVPDGQTYTFARCATAAGIAGCVVSVRAAIKASV